VDLLGKMFEYIPEKRISATEALTHPFFDEIRQDYYSLMQKQSVNT
jgi:serine/threonine protein kinase